MANFDCKMNKDDVTRTHSAEQLRKVPDTLYQQQDLEVWACVCNSGAVVSHPSGLWLTFGLLPVWFEVLAASVFTLARS